MVSRQLERFWRRAGGDRRRFVDEGFAAVAKDYDRLVRLFACGLDRRWRQRCADACGPVRGGWILDCATGTGELALAAARRFGESERVVGVDPCRPMLREARGKARAQALPLVWVQGLGERLPLRSAALSGVTLGFALRHMDIKAAFSEIHRVLAPGGRLALLEFLRPAGGAASRLALMYLRGIVLPLVWVLTRSRTASTLAAYLPQTIRVAPTAAQLADLCEAAGLRVVQASSLFADVVWLLVAVKPAPPHENRGTDR